MHQKLTLSLDGDTIEDAKRYARAAGTSVSALVEAYFRQLGKREDVASGDHTPAVEHLIGIARPSRTPNRDDPKLAYLLDKHA